VSAAGFYGTPAGAGSGGCAAAAAGAGPSSSRAAAAQPLRGEWTNSYLMS
jgi:hypothetical protein